MKQRVDLVRVDYFADLQPLDQFLHLEALEFSLCPGDSFRRLGFPGEAMGLVIELRDQRVSLGASGRGHGGRARDEKCAQRGSGEQRKEPACHTVSPFDRGGSLSGNAHLSVSICSFDASGMVRFLVAGGYAVGALLAGIVADLLGIGAVIHVAATLTLGSGLMVAAVMRETRTPTLHA